MSAQLKTESLMSRLASRGINATFDQAETLRRAAATLARWHELECGDGNAYASWAVERDEETGAPYRCVYYHDGRTTRTKTPDRAAGAERRVKAVCESLGLHYYIQGDPRGCSLYVSTEPLDCQNYSTVGVACEVC
jgi:hypothetical protein